MDIADYDKIEIEFEEFSIMLPKDIIEKFQVDKLEQLIEAKYNPEDEYDVYIVINRILAEKFWEEEITNGILREGSWGYLYLLDENKKPCCTFTECIQENIIYYISIYKDNNLIKKYSPVKSYTRFDNEYQRLGLTDEKIIIRVKQI